MTQRGEATGVVRSASEGGSVHQARWSWFIPLGLIAALAIAYFAWPESKAFFDEAYGTFSTGDQQQIESWVKGFGAWGFVVLIAMMLMQTVLAFLPSLALMVVSVLAYGSLLGAALAWGGMLLAATLGYAIGRSLGVAAVDRLIGEHTERKISRFVDRYGTWGVIAGRISPVLSTDAVSIVAGMARMSYLNFLWATAVGTLPLTVLVAWLGSDVNRLQTGLLWVSALSIGVFVLYVIYDRRWRR